MTIHKVIKETIEKTQKARFILVDNAGYIAGITDSDYYNDANPFTTIHSVIKTALNKASQPHDISLNIDTETDMQDDNGAEL